MEPALKMMFERLINWLESHAVLVEQVGNELRFKHSESRSSIVVLKNEWFDGLIQVTSPLLCSLFDGCLAASIDNGHVIIGSVIEGGVSVSHGYTIPDLKELRVKAVELGMRDVDSSEIFMVEAAWMFLYGVDQSSQKLLRFDRDYGTYEVLSNIENVMNDWRQIDISTDHPNTKK